MDKFYKHQRVELIAMPDEESSLEWEGLGCEVRDPEVVPILGERLVFLMPLADRPDGLERTPFFWPVECVRCA